MSMSMVSLFKIPNFKKIFPRIDLQSIVMVQGKTQMFLIHDDQIMQFSYTF